MQIKTIKIKSVFNKGYFPKEEEASFHKRNATFTIFS